ncbi:uncharacterized protein FFB14_01551 [Fusarium fujikuroi]|nr:uncharacterized protein FFB14_01551 [Fusarium fujikuroi]
MLRYVSGPILAIIFSLAYPSFEEVKNDPLYILGFIVAHLLLVWWFNVFIVSERRDDWKQPYAPNVLRGTTEGEDATKAETELSIKQSYGSNRLSQRKGQSNPQVLVLVKFSLPSTGILPLVAIKVAAPKLGDKAVIVTVPPVPSTSQTNRSSPQN